MFEKDYGARYFLTILLRDLGVIEPKIKNQISEFLLDSISVRWPSYMKFRPASIISLMDLSFQESETLIPPKTASGGAKLLYFLPGILGAHVSDVCYSYSYICFVGRFFV